VQAGLPAPGALGGPETITRLDGEQITRDPSTEPRPGETEVIEDIYED
jgi:hypothetical protein